jgi:molybdopterin molybdotransferase
MISFDEATRIIEDAARPLGFERVALEKASGRILAAPVIAAIDAPRADVSAMDGYAVRGADLTGFPVTLSVTGESTPGTGSPGTVEPGTCVRIFTGAPLPMGSDRIVIQEQVRRDGRSAIIEAAPGPATWVRPQGMDFRTCDEILAAGRKLDPAALIAAAGADCEHVDVALSPRVALLSTGDELVPPGAAREFPLSVPDSVSIGVGSLASNWGASLALRSRVRDDLAELRAAARDAAAQADVIIVTGGASVGERDFAKAMFEPLGLELLFSKISMRPGKPAWFGRIAEKLVLGLPGNPTSALVTARLLLAPLLAAMQGQRPNSALRWEPARLATAIPPCDARETFHRARFNDGAVSLLGFQESHGQKALAEADVLIRQAANSPAVAAGETMMVLRF